MLAECDQPFVLGCLISLGMVIVFGAVVIYTVSERKKKD